MTLPSELQVPPPKDWQDFERRLHELLAAEWKPPVEMHGRTGQPQHGVDIYGQPDGEGAGYHGVQCKCHDQQLGAAVIKKELLKEISEEIEKAKKFKPKISRFIFATTAPRDDDVQALVRKFNERKTKPFPVEVWFWDDILLLYNKHRDLLDLHYPRTKLDLLHQLPAPVRDFVGREKELGKLLYGIDGGATISGVAGAGGLVGMGGVGKTELARLAAHRLLAAGRFADAQFVIDLQGTSDAPLSGAEALARVIHSFDPAAKLPEDETALRKIYLSLLHNMRAIVLADNAAGAEQVRPLLPPPSCLLLVTSRRHFMIEGLRPIGLDCLPGDKAVELLRSICPRIAERAADIARLCGNLPLALRAAASYLVVQRNVSPEEYVQALTDERRRLETIGVEGVELGVEASLALSYRQIEKRDPAAARVFRALSVFPASFDAGAAEAVCEDPGRRLLNELLRYSLVEFDEKDRRYRLHDLVRLFAAQRLDEPPHAAERPAAQERHARRYAQVLREADEVYLKGGDGILEGLSLFDRERANIEAGQAWAAARADSNDDAATLADDYPDAGFYVLYLRRHPRQRIKWLESALAAARRLKNRAAEGTHLGNLGIAYANLGEVHEAIECYEQHLAIAREIGDRRGEGNALGNLGIAYADLGEIRKAIGFYEQHLAITREIADRRGEGIALGNLGISYADLGELRKAIESHEQALLIDREIGDRRGEGADLGNLGSDCYRLGEVHKAIEFFERHLAIAREIGDRCGEGNALCGLGAACADLGEVRKAIGCFDQHLAIAREIADRRGEEIGLGNLGAAYCRLGEVDKAIGFFKQDLVIAREIGHRRGEAYASWNMALAYDALGQRGQAIPLAQAALAIYEQIEDPNADKVRRQLSQWRGQTEGLDGG